MTHSNPSCFSWRLPIQTFLIFTNSALFDVTQHLKGRQGRVHERFKTQVGNTQGEPDECDTVEVRAHRFFWRKRLFTELRAVKMTKMLRGWKVSTGIWQPLAFIVGFSGVVSVEGRGRGQRAGDLECDVEVRKLTRKHRAFVLIFALRTLHFNKRGKIN